MNEPSSDHCLLKRNRRSSLTSQPVVLPQVTRRPAGASDSKLFGHVAAPTCSKTTSTPRFAGELLHLGGNVLLIVIDHVIGAQLFRLGQLGFAAGGRDHAALVQFRDLDGGRAHAA